MAISERGGVLAVIPPQELHMASEEHPHFIGYRAYPKSRLRLAAGPQPLDQPETS